MDGAQGVGQWYPHAPSQLHNPGSLMLCVVASLQTLPSTILSQSKSSINGEHTGYILTPWYDRPVGPLLSLLTVFKGQYVDGLRSPIVVRPPTEKYTYDEEFTVVMGDWYHQEHAVLMEQFISIANPGGAEPVPGSSPLYCRKINTDCCAS